MQNQQQQLAAPFFNGGIPAGNSQQPTAPNLAQMNQQMAQNSMLAQFIQQQQQQQLQLGQ